MTGAVAGPAGVGGGGVLLAGSGGGLICEPRPCCCEVFDGAVLPPLILNTWAPLNFVASSDFATSYCPASTLNVWPATVVNVALPLATTGFCLHSYRVPSFSTTQYEAAKTFGAKNMTTAINKSDFFMCIPRKLLPEAVNYTYRASERWSF